MNLYTLSFLFILMYSAVKSQRSLYVLQKHQYNENHGYVNWLFRNIKEVFVSLEVLSLVCIIIAYFIKSKASSLLVLLALVFYFLNSAKFLNNKITELEKRLAYTKRIKRIILITAIIYLLPIIIYLNNKDNGMLLVLVEALLGYFNSYVVLIARIIDMPINRIIYGYYEMKATEKLSEMPKLKVIGITGTFGKTSSKLVLNDLLRTKYKTCYTPRSLNTLNGVVMTINKHLHRKDQMLIAEMGGLGKTKINRMCRILKPDYAIITNISNTYSGSFKSREENNKSKFELVESLSNKGVAILNMDDIDQTSYNIKSECKKIWISINNNDADIKAENIKYTENGTEFDIVFKGKKGKETFETKLLGEYNVINILASIALGLELGLSIDELKKMVKRIRSPKGKLELINLGYMYQINDIYNSNPKGAKVALDVLEAMNGFKVVVTRGINGIESKRKQLNFMFGNQIASVADMVVLIGSKKTRPIFDGMLEKGYDKDKIFIVNSESGAYNLLQNLKTDKRIYALFENNYND